jgi:hypothetical protein
MSLAALLRQARFVLAVFCVLRIRVVLLVLNSHLCVFVLRLAVEQADFDVLLQCFRLALDKIGKASFALSDLPVFNGQILKIPSPVAGVALLCC